jgi:hypothetical protein
MKKLIPIPLIILGILLLCAYIPKESKDTPSGLARSIAAILAQEKPLEITEKDLVERWPSEIAPYFQYELLTNGEAKPPIVKFSTLTDAPKHFGVYGYTFSFDTSGDIYLNERFRNPVSAKYNSVEALTTLVHETAHIQGGEFNASELCEKNAQLATLEVLASMANDGNPYARQALLVELRDICVGVILSRGLSSGNMDEYRSIWSEVYKGKDNKRFRMWNYMGIDKLNELLTQYCVSVYNDFQDFQFSASAEGDKAPRVFIMDDLKIFIERL